MNDLRTTGEGAEPGRSDGAATDETPGAAAIDKIANGAALDEMADAAAVDEMATTDGVWPTPPQPVRAAADDSEAASSSRAEVMRAMGRARLAQEPWAQLPVGERCRRILSFRDALARHADDLAERLVLESGQPLDEAMDGEVRPLVEEVTRLVASAPAALRSQDVEGGVSWTHQRRLGWVPRGVVAVLSDHGSPLGAPMRDVVAAALAGNAVVVKPSSQTPRVLLDAKAIWDGSETPPDLFQVVTGPAGTAAALIAAGPDRVAFSGGLAAARRVAAACGERLLPCLVRATSRGPLLACADADVERAARAVVRGAFGSAGKSSAPIGTVYAHAHVHDRLLAQVVALAEAWTRGDGGEGEVQRGARMSEEALLRAEDHIERAVRAGAVLCCGGRRRAGEMFLEPTVLSLCASTMSVTTQDTGAPIACFVLALDDDHAVRSANAAGPASHAHLFTSSREHAARLGPRLRAEWVLVNELPRDQRSWERAIDAAQGGQPRARTAVEDLQGMCIAKQIDLDRFPAGAPAWLPAAAWAGRWLRGSAAALFTSGSRALQGITR